MEERRSERGKIASGEGQTERMDIVGWVLRHRLKQKVGVFIKDPVAKPSWAHLPVRMGP